MKEFVITSLQLHELIIQPAFQDLIPDNDMPVSYNGMLQEFTTMNDVKSSRTIVDIRRIKNILQRRDASCDLVYKKVMGASTRKITVDELYAATAQCKHEFYQGCLKDWRANNDDIFGERIQPFFKQAVMLDLASNSYFGDISRAETSTEWSLTKFDGIFKWIKAYYAMGVIPTAQSISMPITDMRANPATAYGILQGLVDKQNTLMRSFPNNEKEIYCSQALLDGYLKYLRTTSTAIEVLYMYANGVNIYSIDGIAIRVITIWEPIMTELYGGPNYNAAILTLTGNFVFATDNEYGEGESDKDALMIWYEKRKLSWYYQMFLKAGTQIALPEHIVFAFPSA